MLLKGFGFSGYRSFGKDLAIISPIKKVNLIIGKNNVGKSNIINYLKYQYEFFSSKARSQRERSGQQEETPFKSIDRHISNEQIEFKIAFPLFKDEISQYVNEKLPDDIKHRRHREFANKVLNSCFKIYDECIWFEYKSNSLNSKFDLDVDINEASKILEHNDWNMLWNSLTHTTGGSLNGVWIPQTLSALAYIPTTSPMIEIIPAIRKIGKSGTAATDFSGEGIIERLAKIQNPPLSNQKEKDKFVAINKFVQNVLENSSATIEIPYERDMILVHMDGKTLPLESLGTGVHEVIILAAASTLLEKTVLCVEEPELHLHPLLQKKLVKYLSDETNNQYFFTTHSAHLLDAVDAEIFHVTQKNGVSYVEAISSTKQRSNICNDLGYKASDILQANCIIWVEGPSDRIYLNYWIKSKNQTLIEGVHYSIMFYGGRLFSHLTALDDDEVTEIVEDFISVRKLNRNSVIMFDSDKSSVRNKISKTKQRLKKEFDLGSGFTWITKGREVENYLEIDNIEKAVLAVHPSAEKILNRDQWSNTLYYKKKLVKGKKVKNNIKSANKVKVAKYYVEHNIADFSVLDLDKQIKSVINFIQSVNG